MTPSKPGRGRPKGSGLDDAAQLRAIASLLAADPELRPTTAIKNLGISDPSVIRRLRDKYHAAEKDLLAEFDALDRPPSAAALHPSASVSTLVPETQPRAVQRSVALPSLRPVTKSEPAAPRALALVRQQARAPEAVAVSPVRAAAPLAAGAAERPDFHGGLSTWMGAGLAVYAFSYQTQLAVIGTMFQWPAVAAVLQSQVAFTDLAIAMAVPGPLQHAKTA
jgi:hypothetical protein